MLRKLLGIRPNDRRDALGGFVVLAGVMASHATLETARDALFLSRLPPEHLPLTYIAIALLAGLAATANRRLLARFDKRRLLSGTLWIASAATLGLWVLVGRGSVTSLYALYVWTGLVATVAVVQLWLMLGDVVTVAQAKRVFGMVAAGGLVGATAGSLLAERLVAALDPRHLLVAAAALMLVAGAGPGIWRSVEPANEPPPRRTAPGGMRLLRSQPYLRRLLVLVLVSTVVLTGVDYVFKSVVAHQIPREDLGSFFARFYLLLNGLGLLFQLLLSSLLVRTLGVNRALVALPVLLLAGIAGVIGVASTVLLPVLLLKGADGSLRHSIHRTAMEVLYLPLPADVRDRFKGLIDGVGQRGGQGLASLAILGAVSVGATAQHLAAGIGVLLLGWLAVALGIQRYYLDLFRGNLREGTIETRIHLSELDLHSLEALMAALNSDEDEEVLAALDLFAEHGKTHLVPVLLLYHPSQRVVLRTLDLFAEHGRRDFNSVARRLMRHDDDVIRAAALRAMTAIEPDADMLRRYLVDDSALVHCTALIGLITTEPPDLAELENDLADHVDQDAPEIRAAVAAAIRQHRDPRFARALVRLGRASDEREVRLEIARAMAAVPSERYMPLLVQMLADGTLRPEARRAILAVGPVALYYLDEALWDDSLPRNVRRHLPRTVSRFEPRRAAEVLMRHLREERDGAVRFKILRGLGRLVADDPRLDLDRKTLMAETRATLSRATELLARRLDVERSQDREERYRTQGGELLVAMLREKETNALERVFRLLGIVFPREDFQLLYAGLHRLDRRARAGALELLEHVLTGDLRAAVLSLVDDAPDAERLEGAATALGLGATPKSYRQRIVGLLDDPSEALQSIAAYHVAELGWIDLADQLRTARPQRPGFLTEVIERALEMMGAGPTPEGHHAA